ncbi:MAG: 2-hydroxyacyl-CoA dehydratase [Clostridiales bacterium]|nr:2-hydroxyacyl-CoA dehydratase [Clostridiales bacterium]
MKKGQLWETRPLDSWDKAKELRAKWQKSIESKEKVVGQGNTSFVVDWQVCFPAITVIEDNPAGSMIAAKNDPFARKSRLACEIRGWGREICGYHGTLWGTQFLGYQEDGSPFPKRKFTVPFPCICDSHTKRGEQCRAFEPIPRWANDYTCYIGEYDEEREKAMLEHRNYCSLKMINEMERVFDQKFDDDKMIEMIRAESTIAQYRQDVSYYMTFKPAPLTVKDIYSFYTLGGLTKLDPEETVNFWKMFRDEVKWRVDNQIAGLGTERYRWMEAHPPSWHYLKYYRYMEQYGAVCIGSQYSNGTPMERKPDGSLVERAYPGFSKDIALETREDEIRYMTGLDARAPHHFKQDEYLRPNALNEFAELYQVDGAMFGLWRGGVGCNMLRKEQAMKLRLIGKSVLFFEGSQPGDRTDLDEKRFLDQLDGWMEGQGLRKLED